jgi:hypothetical protein
MKLIETPIIKRQITIWIVGPSPLNFTSFDLPFGSLEPIVVVLLMGTPPPNSMSVGSES